MFQSAECLVLIAEPWEQKWGRSPIFADAPLKNAALAKIRATSPFFGTPAAVMT
jgi:hypothetical protein